MIKLSGNIFSTQKVMTNNSNLKTEKQDDVKIKAEAEDANAATRGGGSGIVKQESNNNELMMEDVEEKDNKDEDMMQDEEKGEGTEPEEKQPIVITEDLQKDDRMRRFIVDLTEEERD